MPPTLASPRRPQTFRPPPLIAGLYVLDGLMLVLAVAGFVVSEVAGEARWGLVRVGDESTLPTWFSSAQLLLIGLGLGLIALRDVRRRLARTWPLLIGPSLFFLFSLDEAALLHERLGDLMQRSGIGSGLRTGPWMFADAPAVLLALAAALGAYRPYWRGRRLLIVLALAGMAVYGASAVGLEFAANFVTEGSLAQKGLGLAEEIGEMVGATTMLWAVLVLLRGEGMRIEPGIRRAPG